MHLTDYTMLEYVLDSLTRCLLQGISQGKGMNGGVGTGQSESISPTHSLAEA
jgi:hypothetical protein